MCILGENLDEYSIEKVFTLGKKKPFLNPLVSQVLPRKLRFLGSTLKIFDFEVMPVVNHCKARKFSYLGFTVDLGGSSIYVLGKGTLF